MIGVIFGFGNELVEVRIEKGNLLFRNGAMNFYPFDSLKLNKNGVMKEYPDLKDRDDWQEIAKIRFKEKISKMTEREIAEYIKVDLMKHGYVPMYEQASGQRVRRLNGLG